jgi:hypothetical protein
MAIISFMIDASYCVIVFDEIGDATLERAVFDSFEESQDFAGRKLRAGYCVSVYPFNDAVRSASC